MIATNTAVVGSANFNPNGVAATEADVVEISTSAPYSAANPATIVKCTARIFLAHISDAFARMTMPLTNLKMELLVNLNVPSLASTIAKSGAPPGNGGATCPFMITDVGYGQFNGATATGVLGVTMAQRGLNCRLYYPQVKLDSISASKHLTFKKDITWLDHQVYTLPNAGSTIDWAVTPGIANLRRITFIPIVTTSATVDGVSPMHSYKNCEPGTASPGAALTNIGLVINGSQFNSNSISRDSEAFMHHMLQSYNAAGCADYHMASGMIDFAAFQQANRFYTFDVSRNPDIVASNVPVSIQLTATNSSPYRIDLICVCEMAKGFQLNQSSGTCTVTLDAPEALPM
jgi:hypothetical protein